MREYEIDDEGVLTSGAAIMAFLGAFGEYKERGLALMCRHLGEDTVEPSAEHFYSVRKYLNALQEIEDQLGTVFLRRMGRQIASSVQMPPQIDSLEKMMEMMNDAYHLNHRNGAGKIGDFRWRMVGEKKGEMVYDGPFPCSYNHGVLEGFATRFVSTAKVTDTETEDSPCRRNGGQFCTYLVSW